MSIRSAAKQAWDQKMDPFFRLPAAALTGAALLFLAAPAAFADPGSAVDLDGVDDYVSVSGSTNFSLSEVTVSWWVNVPSTGFNDWSDWWSLVTSGGEYVAEVKSDGNPALYVAGTISGAGQTGDVSGHDLRSAGWKHLAAVMSATGNFVKLYVNGTQVGSSTWSASATVTGIVIGTRNGTTARCIRSAIDELRVYDAALDESEIDAIYDSGDGTYGDENEFGLVAGWHFDEDTGTSAADYSGNSHTGTLQGGAGWVEGHIEVPEESGSGFAVDLDGSNDYVSVASSTNFSLSEATVVWWANVPSTGFNDWSDWWSLVTSGGEYVAEVKSDGNPALYVAGTISGAGQTGDVSGHDLRSAGWKHLAAVMSANGNSVKLYVNGTQVGSSTWSASATVTKIVIGTRDGTTTRCIRSSIDEMRVFSRALSSTEIAADYNSGQGLYGSASATGLVAGWHFDEGSGTSAADYSGNGYTGTLQGGATWVEGHVPPLADFTLVSPAFGTFVEASAAAAIQISGADTSQAPLEYKLSLDQSVEVNWTTTQPTSWTPDLTDFGRRTLKMELRGTGSYTDQDDSEIFIIRPPVRHP